MFAKNSRYRKLADDVTVDARGRRLASKSLRLLPDVAGVLSHTTRQGERLDHLAQTYYRRPTQWWPICDANPDFLSPLALLGQESLETTRFDLAYKGSDPPWAALLCELVASSGVEDAGLDETKPLPQETIRAGDRRCTIQTFSELPADFEGEFPGSWRLECFRKGVRPSNQALLFVEDEGWRVVDRGPQGAWQTNYLVRQSKGASSVGMPVRFSVHFFKVIRQTYGSIGVVYNRLTITVDQLAVFIADRSFQVSHTETTSRIGKELRIPPLDRR